MSAPDELLEEVLGRYAGSPNPRLKEVMESAIRHLHAFVREVNPSKAEWFNAISFLTATGQICSETRQEWILMSDTLGVSTLLEMLNYAATDGTMLVDADDGDRVVVRGRITDIDGAPLAGVVLDCWQNATAGFYACQQPGIQSTDNLRGVYRTDADGRFEIRSVRPVPYPIPYDGPVGALLKANARNWMRPGHMHVWLRHPGFKDLITHVFDTESDYLHDDAVFGVRDSLVCTFAPDASGELSTTFDFVLDRA
jgi:catechol 1,2-dioxygenase